MFLAFYLSVEYYLVATSFRSISIGVFAVSLVAIALILENRTPQFLIKLLKPIGDSSYTLYLLHFQLLSLFYYLGTRNWLVASGYAVFGFILMILAVVLISYAFYRILEKPIYDMYTNKK